MATRDEVLKELIKMERTPIIPGESIGEAAHRLFQKEESPYALSNPDYIQHKHMYEDFYRRGFMEAANYMAWMITGKSLLEIGDSH